VVASKFIYSAYEERSEGTVDVVVGQPNFDPYQKFESMSQAAQTQVLLEEFEKALAARRPGPVLLLAPETFTGDIFLDRAESSPTMERIRGFLAEHPGAEMLLGATTYDLYATRSAPTILARPFGDGWIVSHNSAVMTNAHDPAEVYHKSKLVVGTELTPYPKIFVPLDNWLAKKMGASGLMGRCVGQDGVSLLHFGPERIPLGCAVCYESVYGEYCAEYVRKGARFLTVITNDSWWGDTPGYRQHLSYSSLRAIETRRWVARCANTGISAVIDPSGRIVSQTPWWESTLLRAKVGLNDTQTFFVRHGDWIGRICLFMAVLLLLTTFVRSILDRKSSRK
jgi:apolipoprotein N-acyltransferase